MQRIAVLKKTEARVKQLEGTLALRAGDSASDATEIRQYRELWMEEQARAEKAEAELARMRPVVGAAVAVRVHGGDYRNGTHAVILWGLVDEYVAPDPLPAPATALDKTVMDRAKAEVARFDERVQSPPALGQAVIEAALRWRKTIVAPQGAEIELVNAVDAYLKAQEARP